LNTDEQISVKLVSAGTGTKVTFHRILTVGRTARGILLAFVFIHALTVIKVLNETFGTSTPVATDRVLYAVVPNKI
jgi:hypothetical protein